MRDVTANLTPPPPTGRLCLVFMVHYMECPPAGVGIFVFRFVVWAGKLHFRISPLEALLDLLYYIADGDGMRVLYIVYVTASLR